MDHQPIIEKMLVLGTSSIRPETSDWLAEQAVSNTKKITIHDKGSSFFVLVPSSDLMKEIDFDTFPAELREIITYAQEKDCKWINLQFAPSFKRPK